MLFTGNAPLAGAAMRALYVWMGKMRKAREMFKRIEADIRQLAG